MIDPYDAVRFAAGNPAARHAGADDATARAPAHTPDRADRDPGPAGSAADAEPDTTQRLAFTPVPIAPHHRGWSAERQRIFIRALAETACVSQACDAAGVTPRSAYRLRLRAGAESFDRAWREALVIGANHLTTVAFDRAIHGSVRKVWRQGKIIGEEFVPSDRLLIYLLRHYDRTRYGNLSGFTTHKVADPVLAARAALPATLDRLVDHASPPDGDHHECFEILRELEDDA